MDSDICRICGRESCGNGLNRNLDYRSGSGHCSVGSAEWTSIVILISKVLRCGERRVQESQDMPDHIRYVQQNPRDWSEWTGAVPSSSKSKQFDTAGSLVQVVSTVCTRTVVSYTAPVTTLIRLLVSSVPYRSNDLPTLTSDQVYTLHAPLSAKHGLTLTANSQTWSRTRT